MMTAGRVRLVPLDRNHLNQTRQWASDPELMRLMDRQRPVTVEEHEIWFNTVVQGDDCAYFAIETLEDPAHVGNVWLWNIDQRHRKAELRIVIGDEATRGQGLGAEAIDLACRHGFQNLGLHRVYAYVLALNPTALRAFARAGFGVEGTLRDDRWTGERYIDSYLLARVHL
ncbi:MAG: GNAT family N-acetyltransferase [Acidobacteria bacterium]|nr:GNAT family N-acetyltransferase [Acidobacteriota bacterium]